MSSDSALTKQLHIHGHDGREGNRSPNKGKTPKKTLSFRHRQAGVSQKLPSMALSWMSSQLRHLSPPQRMFS